MHLTLKKESHTSRGANILQQQGKFDAFIEEFNNERPHEALEYEMPGGSLLSFLPPLSGHSGTPLPVSRQTVVITNCGRLCLYRKKINLSTVWPAKRSVSRKSTTASGSSASWTTISVISIWRKKLCSPSTTPSGQKCYLCLRNVLLPMSPGRTRNSLAPQVGLEPTTLRLTAECSTIELLRSKAGNNFAIKLHQTTLLAVKFWAI